LSRPPSQTTVVERDTAVPDAVPGARTDADYAQHISALRERAPEGFSVVLERPFVVIGDDDPATVRRRARGTVRWATRMLKQEYFAQDPDDIIDIWLFKSGSSYETHTRALYGREPGTPFGFYSPEHRALFMNISTGGGTLVHEMVHPLMATNFPACPSWFNEGLASLYEQCGERDGRIQGFTNWRLAGLQSAIRAGSLPSFEALMSTTERGFYDEDPGSNYGQARYLCYYLQEKGLLTRYYREFRANAKTDPTGYETLRSVLGDPDMPTFQRDWEAWVLALHYP